MLQIIIWEASIFWKWNGKATLHLGQLFQTANCTYLTFKSVRYRFDLIAGYIAEALKSSSSQFDDQRLVAWTNCARG